MAVREGGTERLDPDDGDSPTPTPDTLGLAYLM